MRTIKVPVLRLTAPTKTVKSHTNTRSYLQKGPHHLPPVHSTSHSNPAPSQPSPSPAPHLPQYFLLRFLNNQVPCLYPPDTPSAEQSAGSLDFSLSRETGLRKEKSFFLSFLRLCLPAETQSNCQAQVPLPHPRCETPFIRQ